MKATFVVILFIAASIASAIAQESVPSLETPAACGSPTVNFEVKLSGSQPMAQPGEGKALIYVVEDQRYKVAKDITVRVGLDGVWVGATRGNSYLSFTVEPGEHHLCIDWVSEWARIGRLVSYYGLTTESGKIYYFRARTMASPANGYDRTAVLDLDLVNSDEGRFLVASSPVSVSHPKK